MVSIRLLSDISIEVIHETFAKAFSDYVEPFKLTFQQLKHMIERRGCDLNLSFGAFSDDELVGFILNGIGEWNGKLTAYDTGTGTIKEFRKQGIASKMFNESLPVLKKHKVSRYLLEVIQSNTAAFDLYKKAGFHVSREFDYYVSTKEKLQIKKTVLGKKYSIKEIHDPNWDVLKTFWDFEPSWQNSIDSINRKIYYFKVLGIFENDTIAGYGIIEKTTGDIPQLAISPEFRKKGLATALIGYLIELSEGNEIKIINTDASYKAFKKFTESINLEPGFGQYEMIKEL
jgi:ribosomal protein S18 acetylase RimI-like enzyme